MCRLNIGLNFTILQKVKLFEWYYVESVAIETDHFAKYFVRQKVAHGYDVTMLWGSKD